MAEERRKRGRPKLPPGERVRDRKQISFRVADTEVLTRFKALREEHDLQPEELFTELVNLVAGDTLARVLGMADHQGVPPGELIARLVQAEWNRNGYRWAGEG